MSLQTNRWCNKFPAASNPSNQHRRNRAFQLDRWHLWSSQNSSCSLPCKLEQHWFYLWLFFLPRLETCATCRCFSTCRVLINHLALRNSLTGNTPSAVSSKTCMALKASRGRASQVGLARGWHVHVNPRFFPLFLVSANRHGMKPMSLGYEWETRIWTRASVFD